MSYTVNISGALEAPPGDCRGRAQSHIAISKIALGAAGPLFVALPIPSQEHKDELGSQGLELADASGKPADNQIARGAAEPPLMRGRPLRLDDYLRNLKEGAESLSLFASLRAA
jgi:hypothetical protein